MSEPEPTLDVEDVLSSIRRLVSEEAKSAANEKAQQEAQETAVETSAEVPESEPVVAPPIEAPESESKDETSEERLILTSAFRVATPPEKPEVSMPEPKLKARSEPLKEAAEMPEPPANAQEETQERAPIVDLDEIENTISQLEREEDAEIAAAAQTEATAKPETDLSSSVEETPVDLSENAPESEDIPEQPVQAAEPQEPASQATSADTPDMDTAMPESQDAFFQDPVAQEAPILDEPLSDAEQKSDITAEDEDILDEESLRDLVSEMVRNELQGELGDRITRNVRKLVRREIHRAMLSKDFD